VGSFGTADLIECEKKKSGEVAEGNGIFYLNSFTRMPHVRDGTSNTLGIGERIGDEKIDHLSTWSGVVVQGQHPFSRILGSSNTALKNKERHPSDYTSAHEKGVHFVMMDASVNLLSHNIDLKTFQQLTTRASEERITGKYTVEDSEAESAEPTSNYSTKKSANSKGFDTKKKSIRREPAPKR
jgi:hypothetical protein